MNNQPIEFRQISVSDLSADPEQPRKLFEEAELQQLAESLKKVRQLVPIIIVAVKNQFVILDGERRWRAARLAGLENLMAVVLGTRPSAVELLTLQLTVNLQRQDLSPLEKLEAFQRLMVSNKWRAADLAVHLQISKASVTRILSHGQLNEMEREWLKTGVISSADAYALTRMSDRSRETAGQLIAEGKLGREACERLSREEKTNSQPSVKRRSTRIELGSCVASISSAQAFNLPDLINWLRDALSECKKALREGLDISTLAKVLADKKRNVEGKEAVC